MTEKEAIRILGETNLCTPLGQAAFVGIESIKKLRQYRSIDERISAAYGENNGLLETLVEYTLKWKTENKAGEMLAKTIMLTDEDVDRWNAYKKIGTVEECREAAEKVSKYEKQYIHDMNNPLEPSKVSSALDSEIFKLSYRKQNNPDEINVLDYTVIAALQKVLGIDWSEEKMGISNGKIEAGKFVAKMNNDNVKHPNHYTAGKIECIEAIKESMTKEEYRGYLKGQVMKYIWRYQKKGKPLEDLQKAQQYLEWLIEEVGQNS